MNKTRILTSQAVPGMIVADDVYTPTNQLIISAGTLITDKVITRLKFYSIHQLYVSVKQEAQIPQPSAMKTELYSEKVKNSEEFKRFSSSLEHSTEDFRRQLTGIVEHNEKINADELLEDVNSVMIHARNGSHVFDMLHSLRDYDDETYMHCINVALICNVLGRWLHFSRKDLDTVTLCGMLHDMGKLLIPEEILRKPGKITEEERNIIRTHPVRGYNILRAQKADIHVQMSAMMHHERCDGSGYPMGMKGDQIDRFAKIVMIADVYEAMTAARVYRGPLCPFEVIGIFESEGLSKFDTRAIMTFLEHVNETYINNNVRLSDHREGKIVMMNPTYLSRPVIQAGNQYIDLSNEPNLYIEAIL